MNNRWVLLACLTICGCSSGDYDAAYGTRIVGYRTAGEFARLRGTPTTVAEIAELRLPQVLENQLDPANTATWATPPFVKDFPGLAAAYEGGFSATDGRIPVVLTVGVVPATERRKDDVEEQILRQVRKDEEFVKAAWQKGQEVVDIAGATRKWDVLELKGPQPFQIEKAEVTAEKRLPGTTEIWVSADPGQKACVILAWRVADDVAANLPLLEISPLTARTVRLREPQP